ncbi:hypothetical protein Tco_0802872 [Tanacetum coccineum]|uniref:Uncharacterized protein n=1 Tax=Tanacetum coccineum TaxID=301880 RepID=A0ABQ5A016_9ASTR
MWELLRQTIDDATLDPPFVTEVMEPLQIEHLMDQMVSGLSRETQRLALCVCLGKVKMGRDTIQLEDAVSTIYQEYLLEFTSEYYIPEGLHLELPGPEDNIVDFLEGKMIGAAKVSHFEINCRVLNIIPTVNLFRIFYISSFNSGWMSFSKRPGKNTPQCYTKPLDSLKNWNNRFFWVDERVFPTVVAWRTAASKDDRSAANTYSTVDVATLDTHRTPIQKLPEELLCLVGLSRNYFLNDDEYPIFLNDNDQGGNGFVQHHQSPNPSKVKTETRPRTAHEVPLLTATASRVVNIKNAPEPLTSSETPSTVERSPLDFLNEDAPPLVAQGVETEVQGPTVAEQEVPVAYDVATAELAPEPDLEKEVTTMGPPGKSLADMVLDAEPIIHIHKTQDLSVAAQSVSDPDPLSYAKPQPSPSKTLPSKSSKKAAIVEDSDAEKSAFFTSMAGSPGSIYQPGWGVTNNCRLDTPEACQDMDQRIQAREEHIKNLETLLEAEADMRKDAKAENIELVKELESLCLQFSDLQVGRTEHRWVIGHGLRLAVMKCAESMELRQAFANVVSMGIAKGMSEGLKHDVKHGKAKLDLAAVEAYDPEADNKYVAALHALKDLNSSQLKIPIYPEVRDPRNPWAFKEEILLEDAIAANISRAEKKKKSRVLDTVKNYTSIIDNNTFPKQKFHLTAPESLHLFRGTFLLNSVNGLLCFYDRYGDVHQNTKMVVIWNPIVRKSVGIAIPVPEARYIDEGYIVVGFGVCPDTSDPKLVKINLDKISNMWLVEVFVDGVIYFLAYDDVFLDGGVRSNFVISFDLKSEEFGEVRLSKMLYITLINAGRSFGYWGLGTMVELIMMKLGCMEDSYEPLSGNINVKLGINGDEVTKVLFFLAPPFPFGCPQEPILWPDFDALSPDHKRQRDTFYCTHFNLHKPS